MKPATLGAIAGAAFIWLVGCQTAGVRATGQNPEAPTWKGGQSETAISVTNFGGKKIITVAFNDDNPDQKKIQYTATTRTVLPGASLMGWVYSEDGGASWTYGGYVTPSDDWPVLWSDPGITSSARDQRFVFMAYLAVPKSKMPAGGITGSLGSHIGGACMARSTDGGKKFSLYQCVHNNFEFYDGGSMASSTLGGIYTAFIAVDSRRYDIWYAKDENAQFERLPDPFPGCRMATHPRIRVGYPALGLGSPNPSLFVAGQIIDCNPGALGNDRPGGFGQIIINRFHNGNWGRPRVIGNPSAVNPDIKLSDRFWRTGPQFSFDVGAASPRDDAHLNSEGLPTGDDEIRLLYTRSDGKRFWVEGASCKYDLSKPCRWVPEWGSTPGYYSYRGDQFMPNVRAFPGFLTIPPAWAATFVSRDHDPAGNTVKIRRGALAALPNDVHFLITFDLTNPLLVCPDNRGYWGDYDDLQFVGFVKDSTVAQFMRAFSDSSAGCTRRWEHISEHLHVTTAVFP